MGAHFYVGVARSALRPGPGLFQGTHPGRQTALRAPVDQTQALFNMFMKIEACTVPVPGRHGSITTANTTAAGYPVFHCQPRSSAPRTAFEVASDAVQIFGGSGVSRECPVEKFFRDARAGLIEDGANDSLMITADAPPVGRVHPQRASFGPGLRSRSAEILDVALLCLRCQHRCGLGLNQNPPFVGITRFPSDKCADCVMPDLIRHPVFLC